MVLTGGNMAISITQANRKSVERTQNIDKVVLPYLQLLYETDLQSWLVRKCQLTHARSKNTSSKANPATPGWFSPQRIQYMVQVRDEHIRRVALLFRSASRDAKRCNSVPSHSFLPTIASPSYKQEQPWKYTPSTKAKPKYTRWDNINPFPFYVSTLVE
jgi:hypothetical protein